MTGGSNSVPPLVRLPLSRLMTGKAIVSNASAVSYFPRREAFRSKKVSFTGAYKREFGNYILVASTDGLFVSFRSGANL
ncbi:hypothetical protein ACJJIP_12150 [Microbulbifer sp. VTAC004]|uniref:hypothetical protein n=1 Tax=Microbulbifer sp. VTAC004 TaxID=3243386 RepID=UPI004038FB5F